MDKNISLYVHIPFCCKKCLYCSFVVAINRDKHTDVYLNCLEKEARKYKGTKVKSIYIGGGTPTYLSSYQLENLGKIIQKYFTFDLSTEINIECNPEDITKDKVKTLKGMGINRISLGIQTLNNKYLKYLGRNHDSLAAIKSYNLIREQRFNNVNIDLMFLFPKQTAKELKEDIRCFIELQSEHISTYALTIEENSRFFVGKEKLVSTQEQAKRYVLLNRMLEDGGFMQYEISNFARPKRESIHNINYWQEGEYIGLGMGAHSFLGGRRFWNVKNFKRYIDRMTQGESVVEGEELLTSYQQFKEAVLFGLRMNEGIDIKQLEKRFRQKLNETDLKSISDFIKEGFLVQERDNIKATEKGRIVLDEICVRII
jgi:oxygen-independent coproporphyrinogen III oxidase